MKSLLLAPLFSVLLASSAFAESATYTIEGMHCESCVMMIKKQVCALEGLEKCEVEVGKMTLVSKEGVKLDKEKIQAALTKAGEKYKITKINQ